MTIEPVTRDEFETVKDLLASAARYAESANRGMAELSTNQVRAQIQMERLMLVQERTEQRLEAFIHESQRLLSGHAEQIAQLRGISERLDGIEKTAKGCPSGLVVIE